MIGRGKSSCFVISMTLSALVILYIIITVFYNPNQDYIQLLTGEVHKKYQQHDADVISPKERINSIRRTELAVLQPEVLRWDGQKWISWPNFCLDNDKENYELADLHAPSGHMPLYVHDSKHDSYTSGLILKNHIYEKSDVELMYRILQQNKEMGLVDVGAHVGLYSATAALMGRNVLTVDPIHMNIHAWCHSIVKNNFINRVKQIYTIMSSEHHLMYFKTEGIHIGGTTVHVAEDQSQQVSPMDKTFIHSATLDDLVPLITFKTVFLKLDVEKHEYEVILGGKLFFGELDVKYVLMEWVHHVKSKNRDKIIEKMAQYGFKAYTAGREQLEVDMSKRDNIYNILWIKVQ